MESSFGLMRAEGACAGREGAVPVWVCLHRWNRQRDRQIDVNLNQIVKWDMAALGDKGQVQASTWASGSKWRRGQIQNWAIPLAR